KDSFLDDVIIINYYLLFTTTIIILRGFLGIAFAIGLTFLLCCLTDLSNHRVAVLLVKLKKESLAECLANNQPKEYILIFLII
ncbi:hypothetical protein ACJX0J_012339, partial [Zea mays]